MAECHHCGPTDRDLRPYGPGGSDVCFPCATATPEREAATKAAFGALLDASEQISPTGLVAIGEPDGPRPFDTDAVDAMLCPATWPGPSEHPTTRVHTCERICDHRGRCECECGADALEADR